MSELIALEQLINELLASPKIGEIAKINLGIANFAVSQAILAQHQKRPKLTISEVENERSR